jgi:hypothetical protein
MTHLQETGQPLDNYAKRTQNACFLTGAFFPLSTVVPSVHWQCERRQVYFVRDNPGYRDSVDGSRSSVMI